MTEPKPSVDELLSQIRDEQDQLLQDTERRESVRRRLAIQEPSAGSATAWRSRLAAGTILAAAAAVLILFLNTGQQDVPLAYEVGGESRPAGEFLATREAESMTLQFSEGSVVELEPETTARVEELTRRGARLSLEHGVAQVSVHHEDDTQWQIQSGPYVVHVVGTRFRISWDATQREFDLQMHEGEVRVEGPFGQRSLRAGQSMNIGSERDRSETEVASPEPSEQRIPSPEPETPPEPELPVEPQTSGAVAADSGRRASPPRADAPPQNPRWRLELQAGRAAEALAAIQNLGQVTSRATAEELRALSTAARRARSPFELPLYQAIRARFAGTRDAAEAAFLAGRRAQSASRNTEADRWFRTYLAEAPGGRWAAEASGRRLEALQAQGLDDTASRWAAQYLRRYPQGAHAPLARSLISTE